MNGRGASSHAIRASRWLLLVPAAVAAWCLIFAATIATHYLAEQHLCPSQDLVSGICSNHALGVALWLIKHVAMALSAIVVEWMCATVAPSHKVAVVWATLAVIVLAAGYLGHAGNAGSLFIAALVGGVAGAVAIVQRKKARASGHPPQ